MNSTEGRPTRLTSLAELGPFFGIEAGEALDEVAATPPADDAATVAPPTGRPARKTG